MGRLIRWFLLLLILGGVIAGIVWALLPRPLPVDAAEVVAGPMRVIVNEEGKTRIRERYIVSSPLGGRLRRITLKPGDQVIADETVLAIIEPTDPQLLDARARAEAQARVRAADAAVGNAGANLAAARVAADFAEDELARIRDAFAGGASSPQELSRAELEHRTARENYLAAESREEIAKYELELAQSALIYTQAPSDNGNAAGEQMLIRSPITGDVLRVFQESVAVVTPGTQLLELGDRVDLELVIDVLSTDAVRIHPGDPVIVDHWGGEEPLEAIVRLVEPSAFTKISALGVEEQRVNVIADFITPPQQRATLGDGYRVDAGIVIWDEPDIVFVPSSAAFHDERGWAVFVIEDEVARRRSIEVGHQNGRQTEVLSGLQSGDVVITHPSDAVRDGISVTPRVD